MNEKWGVRTEKKWVTRLRVTLPSLSISYTTNYQEVKEKFFNSLNFLYLQQLSFYIKNLVDFSFFINFALKTKITYSYEQNKWTLSGNGHENVSMKGFEFKSETKEYNDASRPHYQQMYEHHMVECVWCTLQPFDYLTGVACSHTVGGYVVSHHTTRPYHCTVAYGDPWADGYIASEPTVLAYFYWQGRLNGLATLEIVHRVLGSV